MTPFAAKTYRLLKTVPRGRVTTYKALANKLGTRAYRAIGQLMRNNPYAPSVPCHRVVAADGTIGGYMGSRSGGDIEKKIVLLESEGVRVIGHRIANFPKILYTF